VAFTAYFYGIGDPEIVERWPTSKIVKWYSEAVKVHNHLNKEEDG
jgi:hypothetical protein